ncbi:protein FAR1-RELATED SEQUENCE 5-like [Spinacia oleracea]|uniref:Protein FAR1-RELATED SEQUENCE 5-like n=1 Tax=Spinacia oleracea TaxID=3562 RepID=A0ABM3RA91_SPIOL|nr:protein FAR1-RELATED SEQUENCE 5-like [Spinacia oleracea]XP_056692523.1 protein FAR1-RELATED SEQUENCE 5-like [Spinacia oleracea]XP_056692524.1 protein FAR1-RELATED SEQUENCE 5-like [Spinacia oleracea]
MEHQPVDYQDIYHNSPSIEESGITNEQSSCSNVSVHVTPQVVPLLTPGGTREWIPCPSPELRPTVGMIFESVNVGIEFYKAYAVASGFGIRKSTTTKTKKKGVVDQVAFKYCVCNKAGFKEKRIQKAKGISKGKEGEAMEISKGKEGETMEDQSKVIRTRKRLVTRVGCKARMILKYRKEGGYIVQTFYEGHAHPLYTPGCKKFQKEGRKLNILHKKMIIDNSKLNIGPVTTFRLMKEYFGGYGNVGASKEDFKNFQRDLKTYIKGSDAQMFIDNFKMKKLLWSAFFYDFEVDEDDCLSRALWADPICRRNYALFGDMVSFDTTYSTNRYNMIFGPFTGVDHHKRCITFAVAFIAKEDTTSFEWVFRTFLKSMGDNELICLITDQEPAMKIAIQNVFQNAEHRFCMWHIMKKMPDKIGRIICQDTEFLSKICACVWSLEIEPSEFEDKWKKVLIEFHLEGHDWLRQLFEMRHMWIPAYFRDLFMGGIMRTTSRS